MDMEEILAGGMGNRYSGSIPAFKGSTFLTRRRTTCSYSLQQLAETENPAIWPLRALAQLHRLNVGLLSIISYMLLGVLILKVFLQDLSKCACRNFCTKLHLYYIYIKLINISIKTKKKNFNLFQQPLLTIYTSLIFVHFLFFFHISHV